MVYSNPMSASSQTYFGLPGNAFGLVDKQSQAQGLSELNLKTAAPQVTERENTLMFDSRDCFGELSLREAQLSFAYDVATRGQIPPDRFRQALNSDGVVVPQKLVDVVKQLQTDGGVTGFPDRSDNTPWVSGNTITFRLRKILKDVKSAEIINAIIPRDIIPVYVYFPGFINNCLPLRLTDTGFLAPSVNAPSSTWESPILETPEDFFDNSVQGLASNRLGGVYQTPLRYWRAYTGPNCMANPHTPPPYQLWNPPQDPFSDNPWPFQPQPVRQQRVPTYVAKNGVVFAGYGLYDLEDFPEFQELQVADGTSVRVPLRKLFLKYIVPEGQFLNGVSARDLIDISSVNDFNDSGVVDNPLTQTGYGDYQRFVPGPGVGMNYQPNQWRDGKAAPIELAVSTFDPVTGVLGPMPVPFPNFRGNVWGPYGRPGDRFQNNGLQQTVDELYLNGDLRNLEGNPIVWPGYDPSTRPYSFDLFVAVLRRANNVVRFRTFETAANLNMRNAMRVQTDGGFGAVFAYVGPTTSARGVPGPIITGGLPNTQYDGALHRLNPDVWIQPRTDVPSNWIESLPGPQKPTIVSDADFPGWIYVWRDIFPWTGTVYVPSTAGGAGPQEYFDGETWRTSVGTAADLNYTLGSSQWVNSPVIGQSNVWCIPSSNDSTFEIVSNLPFGQVLGASLSQGGSNYQDTLPNFPAVFPRYAARRANGSDIPGLELEVTSVDPPTGRVLAFTVASGSFTDPGVITAVPCSGCNPEPTGPSGENWTLAFDGVTLVTTTGGSGYTPGTDLRTVSNSGNGSDLTVDVLAVGPEGQVTDFVVRSPGSGYVVGDIVTILQRGSGANATIVVTDAAPVPDNLVPEHNVFHYTDPLAVGPAVSGFDAVVNQDYVNGVDECTTDCPNNCTPPIGQFEFCIGQRIADTSTARDDPRPTPDPPCMLKCDFVAQESPEQEYLGSDRRCRNPDNPRLLQRSTFVDKRVAFNDSGANNGNFISQLINYRLFFVSSTQDTDLIVHVRQARRDVFTQSLNPQVDQSNFYIPIRLNLGTTSGTLEYVEAVQGTLTSQGVYWKKNYYPPKKTLGELSMDFFAYDGTPIPLERSLGFVEQISDQAQLFSSSIVRSNVLHGNYTAFSPNLPPFVSTAAFTPSSVLISSTNNSKTLSNPFDGRLERYTQRNLGLMFKFVTYQGQNPGITDIIKKMPDADRNQTAETFVDTRGTTHELFPLAANIDDYTD